MSESFIPAGFFKNFRIIPGECWLWIGTKSGSGYGEFFMNKKHIKAHRISYIMFAGKIRKGMQLDHLCRIRHCVNPNHLEVVTPRENILRGFGEGAKNKRKTKCIRGHEFAGKNLKIDTLGKRVCMKCKRITDKRRRAKAK